MYYVITFLGHFQPPPFFSVIPLTPISNYVIHGCSLPKKHSIITKVSTKKLTHTADPVLYQYYQPTYLLDRGIFFFEIIIFFFSNLFKLLIPNLVHMYLLETIFTRLSIEN